MAKRWGVGPLAESSGPNLHFVDYSGHAIDQGSNVQSAAYVECRTVDGQSQFGCGLDTDVATASARAILSAANRAQTAAVLTIGLPPPHLEAIAARILVGRRDCETLGAPAYARGVCRMINKPQPGSTEPTDATVPVPVKTPSNRFFRQKRVPLPHDDARRQGDISSLAYQVMGGRDPALAFLNEENAALGGRPLALATASAEGYARVADAIRAWPAELVAE